MRKCLACLVIVLSLALAGCGGPAAPPPDRTVIDLSHEGDAWYGFGDGAEGATGLEASRWQTFIAPEGSPVLTSVEVKIRRKSAGAFSPVSAYLLALGADGKPDSIVLASGWIPPGWVPTDGSPAVLEIGLYYDGLVAGKEYAVVLSQETITNAHYEWCTAKPGPVAGLHFGKLTPAAGYVDETESLGNGWLKVHVARTKITEIRMFLAGRHDGNLKGDYATARAGADAFVRASLPPELAGKTVHAFISIDGVDQIYYMPYIFGFPTHEAVLLNADGSKMIDDDWTDALNGAIANELVDAFPGMASDHWEYWWSGSSSDGLVSANTCNGWTDNTDAFQGTKGLSVTDTGQWLDNGSEFGFNENFILGIAY